MLALAGLVPVLSGGAPAFGHPSPSPAGMGPRAFIGGPHSSFGHLRSSPVVRMDHPIAPPRSFDRGAHPLAPVIDPNMSYVSEPAPLGVTDFGVTPGGTGYAYGTPEFVASATIRSLSTFTSSSGSNMTFQLNVEDVVSGGGSTYVYWIQDVAFVDTSARQFVWADNVWNLSAPGVGLSSNSVAGNGSVFGGTYYADQAFGYPGSPASYSEPTTILARVVASNVSGAPHVGFQYNDGSGWVTFDNVTFPFLTNGVNHGFLVSGFQYAPSGLYLNAEWTMGGPGGGLSQKALLSDADMGLSYWNGHNLQAVRAAYNHGGNTAEGISNIVDRFGASNGTGAVFGHATNGSGALGPLYGPSEVSTLRIGTGNLSSGVLLVNGVAVSYIGSAANLTLAPGSYEINLTGNGTYLGSTNVTLAAGEFRAITLAPFAVYPLVFFAVGLPPLTPWSVNVSGSTISGGGAVLSVAARDGIHPYTVGGVAGYATASYRGTAEVNGTTTTVTIHWSAWLYPVKFVAENFPGAVPWAVAIGGTTVSGSTAQLSASFPNGTYTYAITADASVVISPVRGSVTIQGSVPTVTVGFAAAPGGMAGNVSPAGTSVTIDGQTVDVTNGSFSVTLAAGVYSLAADRTGYSSLVQNVTVSAGRVTHVDIALHPLGGTTRTSQPSGSRLSLPGGDWLWIGAIAAVAVGVGAVALFRRSRSPPPRRAP
jgi:thermopsin/PEGA domain-containing protein